MSEHSRTPTMVSGTRIYAPDGDELAVATKSSPRWRNKAQETARLFSVALNSHDDLVIALKLAEASLTEMERDQRAYGCDIQALRMVRAALAAAQKGE